MKNLKLFIFLFALISCKKENIYYYSDNKPIKNSTTIRFIDEELDKLNVNTKEKNLRIYTTLDSTSYKSNLDSIRNKIFEEASSLNPEDKKAFDEWFREKIIVIDNKTRKVVNFYSSFRNEKYDRKDVSMGGLRKFIRIGNILYKNPDLKTPDNYLFNYSAETISGKELEISKEEAQFLLKFNIGNLKTEGYFYNYISFLDALKIFQTYNDGLLTQPFTIKKVLHKDKIVYSHKDVSRKIFNQNSLDKIQQNLQYYKENSFGAFKNQLKETESLLFFGYNNIDYFMFINDGKYTYLIYNFSAVITDWDKKKTKQISNTLMKKAGIRYYNAIRE